MQYEQMALLFRVKVHLRRSKLIQQLSRGVSLIRGISVLRILTGLFLLLGFRFQRQDRRLYELCVLELDMLIWSGE